MMGKRVKRRKVGKTEGTATLQNITIMINYKICIIILKPS